MLRVTTMKLSVEEIEAIAEWSPIQAGFGRDDNQTGIRIQGIVDSINTSVDFGCEMLSDDGLSNYYVLFAFNESDVPKGGQLRRVDGLLIYLSACGPVGVVGRSQKRTGPRFSSHDPLEIETLISPDHPGSQLEESVFASIRSGGYHILSTDEVSRPLPTGIKPYEYCFSSEPWDRVFHALFGNTD